MTRSAALNLNGATLAALTEWEFAYAAQSAIADAGDVVAQPIEKLTATSGKSVSAGASGASQETAALDFAAFLVELLKQAAKK